MIIGYIYNFRAFPPSAGNHRHAYELVQGFHNEGHNVRVMEDPSMPNARNYSRLDVSSFLNGLDILYIRVDARPMRNSIFSDAIDQCVSSTKIVWEVNSPANESLAYSFLGGKLDLRKEPILKRLKRLAHAAKKLPGLWLEEKERKRLAKKADAFTCVTSSLADYCQIGLNGKRITVIPNGANPGKFPNGFDVKNPNSTFKVLYSGSAIYPWQGLNFLKETAELSLASNLEIEFIFCVSKDTEYVPKGKNTKVFVGLSHEEILDQIYRADVCIALYPDYPWSRWGLHNSPMKLFEYFSCGSATITSNIGQMKELFKDGEVTLLTSNDPKDILANIRKLYDDPELKLRIGKNAYNLIETNMNWKNVSKKTLEVFHAV